MWEEKSDHLLSAGILLKDFPVFSGIKPQEEFITLPYCILITQACDIASYYKILLEQQSDSKINFDRQTITQMLFLPAFEEEPFIAGKHFETQYRIIMKRLESSLLEQIKKKRDFRYHFLESKIESLPNLYIDFKQYFTIPAQLAVKWYETEKGISYKLKHIHYVDIADRFAHYLQRVAIP